MSNAHDVTTEKPEASGLGRKTLPIYLLGFVLSLVLTVVAFLAVGQRWGEAVHLYVAVTVLALVQLFVQVVCFLRLNASPTARWNLVSFVFTVLVVVVLVGGSVWIMYNLNYNMMH